MTEAVAGILPSIFSAVSLFGLQTLVTTLKKSAGAGAADNPLLTSAVNILGNVAGARVDANFVNWFRRSGQKWIDRTGKVDPNHTLPRAVFLSSCIACYVAGKRFAKRKNLKTRDWAGPFSSAGQWFEQVVDHMPHSLNDAAQQAWLEEYLSAVVEDYKSIAKGDWTPDDIGDLSAQTGHLADRLELLVRTAEGKGTELSVGLDAADTTLAHLRERHKLPLPPDSFEQDFRKDWFDVLCLDFVARLRADTPTFNMFVASQLAALQTERPGLPDSALDEVHAILESALLRLEAKVDRIIDTEFPDVRERLGRIESGINGFANSPRFDGPEPEPEPANLPAWGERPVVIKSLPRRHHMPYASLEDRFIERTRDLWLVHDAVGAKGLAVAIGTGGLGKSQLAIEYVWRFGRCYPGGVFWVEAERGRGKIVEQVASFADITIDGSLEEEFQIRLLWKKLATAPVLVVFNNFPDEAFLRDWRPAEGLISVLITARRRGIAPESEVPLAFFKPEESLALLNSGTRRYIADEAQPLIEELGGLPLPLELARGNLESQPSLSIDSLMDQMYGASYSQMWSRIAEKYRDQLPAKHGKSVMATFQLSWERVESDDAREVLQAVTELAPDPVPIRLLQRVPGFRGPEGAEELELAVDELVRLSLADRVGTDSIQVHRLILGFVRECDPGEWELEAHVAEAVADEMDAIWDLDNIVENAPAFPTIAPHAEALYDSDRCAGKTKFRLASAMYRYQEYWGRYRESLEWATRALDLAKRYHRGELDIVADARSRFGRALSLAGQYRQAAQVLREVLELRKVSVIGAHDLNLALAQTYLGTVLVDSGEPAEAKKLLQKALESFKHELKLEDMWITRTQVRFGTCLRDLGELQDARQILTLALTSIEARYGPRHTETGATQNDFGLCLMDLAEYDMAKVFLEKSLDAAKSFRSDSPNTAAASGVLGECLCSLGQYDAGIELLNRALILSEANFPPGHHWIALLQAQIASTLIDLERCSEAKERLDQSIESSRITDQPDSRWKPATQRFQGRALLRLGQYQDARETAEEALSVDKSHLPPGHPKIAMDNALLGLTLIKLGDGETGWPLLNEARATLAAKLKPNHADLARLKRDIDALLGAAAQP